MNEQITIFYKKDKKHTDDYRVKVVLTQDLENYTITLYYMIYVIMILLIQIITLLAFLTICIVGGSNDYE